MKVELKGVEEVLDAIRRIPASIDTKSVFSDVSEKFADRLRAATPPGYSGRLEKSVLWQSDEEEGLVGYDEGVERAGNPALDSVIRPNTRGRSVLKWVAVDELESILEETFTAYAPEAVTYMESELWHSLKNG
jgi:hypothetical protein